MLLETKQLTKRFRNPGKGPGGVLAVSQANITLNPGETVGLFGGSGSGESTLGLMLAGLLRPTSGEVLYRGEPVRMPYRGACRRNIQVLFQHPEVSFNPMLPLIRSMEEPYRVHQLPYSLEILHRDIARFGLRPEHMQRLPAELSGGELQRAALARVLVLSPEILVLDEPTSMLDVITQAQMVRLLREYQAAHDTAYIFITHNRTLCDSLCSRVYHVEQGIVEEEGVKL